jgi:hypothetical protein
LGGAARHGSGAIAPIIPSKTVSKLEFPTFTFQRSHDSRVTVNAVARQVKGTRTNYSDPSMSEKKGPLPDALSDQIVAIEREVDSNSYRAGPWARLVNEVRALPIAERRSVAENLSRISRKLHRRSGRSTVSDRRVTSRKLRRCRRRSGPCAGHSAPIKFAGHRFRSALDNSACQSHRRLPAQRSPRVCVSLWDRAAVQDVLRPVPGPGALRAPAVSSVRDDRLCDWRLAADLVRRPVLRISIHVCWGCSEPWS